MKSDSFDGEKSASSNRAYGRDRDETDSRAGRDAAIDWTTILAFLSQFEEVKSHLVSAGLEFLLALKALLDQALSALEKEFPEARSKYEFLYALQYMTGFLAGRAKRQGPRSASEQEARDRAKAAALESIIAVIDGEIRTLDQEDPSGAGTNAEAREIRRAAMGAIKNVLEREMQRGASRASNAAKSPGPTAPRRSRSKARRVPVD